jgi:hypothetical protein
VFARADFRVEAPPGELARLAVDGEALRAAARLTGGKSYGLADAARLPEDLPAPEWTTLETMPRVPLASPHALLAVLASLLGLEWVLRRRGGLV